MTPRPSRGAKDEEAMTTIRPVILALVLTGSGAVILAGTGSAWAQDALGQGDRLDANLQSGSQGRNARAPVENYFNRNLVVTGDVAGGRQFRGSVGYTMPGAFSEPVGSDADFFFRSYSYPSSYTYLANEVPAGRFQPGGIYGDIPFFRSTTPPPVGSSYLQIGPEPEFRRQTPISSDPLVPADLLSLRLEDTSIAGAVRGSNYQTIYMTGSSLTGVQGVPPEQLGWDRLSLYDKVAVASDRLTRRDEQSTVSRPGMITDTRVDVRQGDDYSTADPRLDAMQTSGRIQTDGYSPDIDAIVQGMVELYRSMPNVRLEGDPEVMRRVREALGDALMEPCATTAEGGIVRENFDRILREEEERRQLEGDSPAGAGTPGAVVDPITRPRARPEVEGETEAEAAERQRMLTVDELATILSHGRRIEDFSPDERRMLDRILAEGERELAAGEFFNAESTFNRVLLLALDHPLASAGRVHAQLGAGLYRAAAINLRKMIATHPELIDARFGARLLPPLERVDAATAVLRQRLSGPDGADYGLLLAYLGHQVGNRELVHEGLEALPDGEDGTLRALLERLWLNAPTTGDKP